MKVSNSEGIANQTGPESCVAHREVRDEALTGEPAGNGNLWSSGSRGIFCVSKHELNDFFDGKRSSVNCRAFGKADGLKSPDCSNVYFPSGCRSSDGRLWFATIAGLAVIDPNHIQLNSLPPPVQIEQVVVDLSHVFPVRPGNQSVELGPGAHHLEFDYAGLSFTAPEKVRFKYKLDGFDKDWIDAGTSGEAYYTNLAPGSYRFRVIACNNDGLWIPEQAAAATTIVVRPHFDFDSAMMELGLITSLAVVRIRSAPLQMKAECRVDSAF